MTTWRTSRYGEWALAPSDEVREAGSAYDREGVAEPKPPQKPRATPASLTGAVDRAVEERQATSSAAEAKTMHERQAVHNVARVSAEACIADEQQAAGIIADAKAAEERGAKAAAEALVAEERRAVATAARAAAEARMQQEQRAAEEVARIAADGRAAEARRVAAEAARTAADTPLGNEHLHNRESNQETPNEADMKAIGVAVDHQATEATKVASGTRAGDARRFVSSGQPSDEVTPHSTQLEPMATRRANKKRRHQGKQQTDNWRSFATIVARLDEFAGSARPGRKRGRVVK